MTRKSDWVQGVALTILVGGVLVTSVPAYAGVTVALTPPSQRVVGGSLVHIDITLTQAGSPINGFDAFVGFDPAALTPIERVPVEDQIGLLMREACPDYFHIFHKGNETPMDTVTLVLLCNGVSVTGPGQIYSLLFQASTTPQITHVRFLSGLRFYNEGLYVMPVYSTDAVIGIDMDPPQSSVGPGEESQVFGLRVVPNPTGGETVFAVSSDRQGMQSLMVVDLLGRVVRRFEDTVTTPGARTVFWDGRDAAGCRLPTGVYFVKFVTADLSASERVLLIR